MALDEAIVLQSTILSLGPPSPRVLNAFRSVFHNADSPGGNFPTLGGSSSSILDNTNDLSTLHRQPDEDKLTRFFRNYLAFIFVVCFF